MIVRFYIGGVLQHIVNPGGGRSAFSSVGVTCSSHDGGCRDGNKFVLGGREFVSPS